MLSLPSRVIEIWFGKVLVGNLQWLLKPLEMLSPNNTANKSMTLPALSIPFSFSKSSPFCSKVFCGRGLTSDVKMQL